MVESLEGRVLSLWQRWGKTAFGRRLYSLMLGHMVPYSGTICPLVLQLKPGFVRIELQDRRALRAGLVVVNVNPLYMPRHGQSILIAKSL